MTALDGVDILQRIRANFRDPSSRDRGESIQTLDPSVYTDKERFDKELDVLFRKRPQLVAHISELREPGDFVTAEIAGVPILVARDEHGEVHALVNVCLHRCATVETAPSGNKREFVCPYHAWSYGADGRLTSVTDAESFDGASLDGARLRRLPTLVRHGLVFAVLEPGDAAPDLGIGDMGAQFDELGLAEHECFRSVRVELSFNWKLAIDGSLESYHLNFLHPTAAIFSGMVSPFDFYGSHGEHSRFCVGRKAVRKLSDEEIKQENLRNNTMISYNIFPNAFVTAPHDHIILQYYRPLAVDRAYIVYKLLVPAGTREERAAHWEKTWEMGLGIMYEDYSMSEGVQRTFAAGYQAPLMFGRYEHAVARFHANCERMLASA